MKYTIIIICIFLTINLISSNNCYSVATILNSIPDSTSNLTALNSVSNEKHKGFLDECHATELNNDTLHSGSKRTISVNKDIFAEYLKNVDLKLLPGLFEDMGFKNWSPSAEIQRDLPAYFAGFDRQNRPIRVYEYGKQNFQKYALGGKRRQALFAKYNRYCVYQILKAMALKSTKEHPVTQYVLILDLEGLKPSDILNQEVLQLQLKMMSDYRRWTEKYIAKLIFLNMNFVSENLLNLGRYFLLRNLNKFEVYGTNKAFWVPQLLKIFPKDQLPEKYGGCKGFQPYSVV